jgi:hypothetical protein
VALNEASPRVFGADTSMVHRENRCGNDLRHWRARSRQLQPIDAIGKLGCFLAVTAGIFFAWQGFIARVQYFGVVASRSQPLEVSIPIAKTIMGFVRQTLGTAPPASAYDLEQRMSSSALISRWEPLITQAAQRFDVPAAWLEEVMRMESGGRTMAGESVPIVSRAGAMGLMQLMPGTYADMRAQYGLGTNPFDPHDNIFAGAAYLKWLHEKYGFPAMFAAYNDGPANLEAHMNDGRSLPPETRNYVARIADTLGGGTIVLHRRFAAHIVKLTRPNGEPVTINAAEVTALHAVLPGEYAPDVKSVITVGRIHQGVRESLVQVAAMMRTHHTNASTEKPKRITAVFFAAPACASQGRCELPSS